ncbi:surface antigen -like protein [Chrysochromulina tobinii]|uniref:Surface antigen-like protein n=1 Tax=Chrysochromulina tobinii TaxID=1460289 RepID=A0A0M0K2Z2_9EUKA|nr:surface antigen -like protein [Chrysochromulina tobinii]|eukprot:KOO33184.1 surface antigen -like protein [Chrysochromulina sp. CCMP291]
MKRRRVGDVGDGDDIGGDGVNGDVRVRSAEGEEVAWSRSAAARSAALANWVSDTGGAEGAFATLVPAAALRTLSRVAEGDAEEGGALKGCSLAQLAQLLHGAHFLDVDVELLRLLSRSLCTSHLAGKSGPELGRLLGVVSDFPIEAERQAATEEPLYTHDAQDDATAPRAADAPTPPAPVCWLSTQLVNEDALEDALADADVPTLRALKGVSLAWRARARRVLCARLCARVGLPLTSNLVEVTELDLSDSRAAGRLIADAADASRWLPNMAKVTGLGGFEVDVAALRRVESSGEDPYPMEGVRACIRGEGEAPKKVLLAACVLRHGEACVPANAFCDDRSMRSIVLPAGLTSIGEHAFSGCSSLTSIALPAGLTSIGDCAFNDCSSMMSIELPAGLTSLGGYAFCGCSSLTSIELPASLTSLGVSAFDGCSSLTSIELPAGLTSLGERAFYCCSSMTLIALPAGLTSIGECAFDGCDSLTSIELPASLTSLGEGTFWGCSSLMSIALPTGLTSISANAFFGCFSLTSIQLPAGLTSLGTYAFQGCSSMTSIALPAGLTSIGEWAFGCCSSLTSINLPAGLTSIGEGTFAGCSSLTSIALPAGLTSIGDCAFNGCSSMTLIELPAGLTSLGRYAFNGCSSLTLIALPAGFDEIILSAILRFGYLP